VLKEQAGSCAKKVITGEGGAERKGQNAREKEGNHLGARRRGAEMKRG